MSPYVWAPRDNASACGRHFTPFFVFPGIVDLCGALSLGLSCPLRSLVRSRLGEGRIRNLFRGIRFIVAPVLAVLLAASAAPAAGDAGPMAKEIALGEPSQNLAAEKIASLIRAHLQNTTFWKESEIVIRSVGNMNGMENPPADSELRIASAKPLIGQKHISIPIEIVQAGQVLRSCWISASITIRAEVLTAARQIPSGKILSADDVERKSIEIPDLRTAYFRTPEDALGKIARRRFSEGEALTGEHFAEPFLVRSGETVRLRLEREGIVLTALARAEQDGKLGQMIRVRNVDFSTPLKAQVTGRAEVKMQ
jgi:flagella basal body P-ring formation protein FlgA